jgi:hypothetical protein
MAQIPLAQIPNAPDLSSMSAPQTNTVNIPTVDFTQERKEISHAYSSAEQNVRSAGLVGGAIADVGTAVSKVAGDYMKKQQALDATAAKAQFDGLSRSVMEDVSSSLDPSQPHTWGGQFNQKWQQVDDWYKSQPTNIQQAIYPEYIHDRYMNQASIGIAAHKTDLANKVNSTLTEIEQLSKNGQYPEAQSRTEDLMHSGGIPVEKKNEIFRAIESYKTAGAATSLIAQDPGKAADIFQRAATARDFTNAPDWMKGLSPKELENYGKQAESVKYYRETDQGMVAYDAINYGKIKTLEQLEGSEVYKRMTPDWQAAAKSKLLNEVVAGSPEGIKAVGDAFGSLNAFRVGKPGELAKDYHDMKLKGATLPPADAKPFLKEVDDIFQKRSENGGSLPYDQQIRTSVSAELHKMYKDGGFGDPSSSEALSAYKQAEADWNKVTAENPHSYAEAESKYWQTQKNAAAAAALQKGPAQKPKGVLETIMDTIRGSKPQASNDAGDAAWKPNQNDLREDGSQKGTGFLAGGFQPIGDKAWSVTSYGYPGDTTPDANSSAGIGAFTKHLTRDSFGTSYDVEDKLRQAGVKPGDKVDFKLSNGQVVTKIWHDRGATPEQARRMGLRNYYGRVDLYSPDAPHELAKQGVKVVGFKPYTENGQG